MRKTLLCILFTLCLFGAARADDLSDADTSAFKAVIAAQLQAFKDGDGPKAYSYAAPRVTQIFPSPEIFMQMVQNGYGPVLRNDDYRFGPAGFDNQGRPAQRVRLKGTDGKDYDALYYMEKQSDGSWNGG